MAEIRTSNMKSTGSGVPRNSPVAGGTATGRCPSEKSRKLDLDWKK